MQVQQKIAVIGCRNVAPASGYSLLNGPARADVVLIGEYATELLVSISEIIAQFPLRTGSTVRVGEAAELNDAEICVLSSGEPPREHDTEDSFLFRNVSIVRDKGIVLRENGFGGVLIVTTHPAEIMAHSAMEASGLPPESVIGIGSGSVAHRVNADRDLPLVTWCSAEGCGVEFIDSCHPDCPNFESMVERLHRSQVTATQEAVSTTASCVMRVCEAILSDERTVLPVATLLNGQHAVIGTFTNVPCVIGRRGVERILELPLTDAEQKNLLDTARETGRLFYRLTKRALSVSNGKTA